jgi:hypothetical protein
VTNEEFRQALRFVAKVIEVASDPVAMARLGMLKAETDGTLEWLKQFEPVEGYENAAKRGTCPTCGKSCSLNADESLRRHKDTKTGKKHGRCEFDRQMPVEIIPAVFLIADLSDRAEGVESDDGVHKADSNHF